MTEDKVNKAVCEIEFNEADMVCVCCPGHDDCRDGKSIDQWEAAFSQGSKKL